MITCFSDRGSGRESIAGGAWDVPTGEPGFTNGAIIRFPDRSSAVAWYNSPDYQPTFAGRALGIDRRYQLIGGTLQTGKLPAPQAVAARGLALRWAGMVLFVLRRARGLSNRNRSAKDIAEDANDQPGSNQASAHHFKKRQ